MKKEAIVIKMSESEAYIQRLEPSSATHNPLAEHEKVILHLHAITIAQKEEIGQVKAEITRLQEKYDENGYEAPPIIKLHRMEQHIDASLSMFAKELNELKEEKEEFLVHLTRFAWKTALASDEILSSASCNQIIQQAKEEKGIDLGDMKQSWFGMNSKIHESQQKIKMLTEQQKNMFLYALGYGAAFATPMTQIESEEAYKKYLKQQEIK